MNKRYMDFVPAKAVEPAKRQGGSQVYKSVPEVSVRKKVRQNNPDNPNNVSVTKPVANDRQQQLGVVEDLNQKFVKRDVPKRPLGQGKSGVPDTSFRARNAAVRRNALVEKPVENSCTPLKEEGRSVSNSPFINQGKVVKRPLSRNVQQTREINEPTKSELTKSAEPVTMISKPKKESHVNIVVTIIITIVLGAAAGTVAFLLLPK